MRCFVRDSANVDACSKAMRPYGRDRVHGRARAVVARAVMSATILAALLALSASPAWAASSSGKVALIPGAGPNPPAGVTGQDGIMPTSQNVSGRTDQSFNKFSFTNVSLSQITPAELAQFDTVALIQVSTGALSPGAKSALAQFVANGGKLIIHDADETHNNDYSWILPGSSTTQVGAGCPGCGLTSGSAQIKSNSSLISSNPADSSFVDVSQLQKFTDAIGDANLLVSFDPRWFAAVTGTNGRNESGALLAFANNNGLVIYNGFDTDMINSKPAPPWRCINGPNFMCPANGSHPTEDFLAEMWYSELNTGWGSASTGLPTTTPVNSVGTPVPPAQAGLPTSRCVAKRTIFLQLKKLVRAHPRVVQIDVYVKGRHVLRERKGHLRNVTLKGLPKKGSYVVKIVATTNRHFHLISKLRYRAC
jgi:hypothetical protein